jgi:hypothetical protein
MAAKRRKRHKPDFHFAIFAPLGGNKNGFPILTTEVPLFFFAALITGENGGNGVLASVPSAISCSNKKARVDTD